MLDHRFLTKQQMNYKVVGPCNRELYRQETGFVVDVKVDLLSSDPLRQQFAVLIEQHVHDVNIAFETRVVKRCVAFGIFYIDFIFEEMKTIFNEGLLVFKYTKVQQIVARVLILLSDGEDGFLVDVLQEVDSVVFNHFGQQAELIDWVLLWLALLNAVKVGATILKRRVQLHESFQLVQFYAPL